MKRLREVKDYINGSLWLLTTGENGGERESQGAMFGRRYRDERTAPSLAAEPQAEQQG